MCFLVIILIIVIILKFYFKQEIIKIGSYGALIVLTGSMEPTLYPKEMIIIKEQTDYKENDIVTYKDNLGILITHRIIQINGNRIITQGDNNNSKDEIINKKDIQGKVVLHSSVLGFIFLYILKPLIIIICAWYIFGFLKYVIYVKILLKLC